MNAKSILGVAVAVAALAAASVYAQHGFSRKMLQDHSLSVSDRHAVQVGESFFIPAGTVHDGKNIGKGPAKVLATYAVEKGKPVASPAK